MYIYWGKRDGMSRSFPRGSSVQTDREEGSRRFEILFSVLGTRYFVSYKRLCSDVEHGAYAPRKRVNPVQLRAQLCL